MGLGYAGAQDVAPTPVPVRIQTPDLAFVDALQTQLSRYQRAGGDDALLLSLVAAEPASDSLMSDIRSNGRRFAGAFVPHWLIPDLVRDAFIESAVPPPSPLPHAIAQLRSFGGEWVSTDLDHDCDLLYVRRDLLANAAVDPPETWTQLLDSATSSRLTLAIPQNHAQQSADHFCAMAASFVGADEFWFDPEGMAPAIASAAHQQALETWKSLARLTPDSIRSGSTGDLWDSFLNGSSAMLVASADFFPFAIQQAMEPNLIGIVPLPGVLNIDKTVQRAGNVAGPNWGGVAISGSPGVDAASGYLEYVATADAQFELVTDPTAGITPAVADLEATRNEFSAKDWPVEPTMTWLSAISQTYSNPVQLPALRVAETRRYLLALENRIVPYLASDAGSASETLEAAANDWEEITEAIGVSTQRDLHQRSLMPPPTQ